MNLNLENYNKKISIFSSSKNIKKFFSHPRLTLLCWFYAFFLVACVFILRCSFKETACVSVHCIIALTPFAKIKLMFHMVKVLLKMFILIPCHLWKSDHKFSFGKVN